MDLGSVAFFGGIAAVLWKYFDGRHKERMSMLEKGINPVDIKSKAPIHAWHTNILGNLKWGSLNLKWGLLFLFVGIGVLAGEPLHNVFGFSEEIAYTGNIFITGGLALLLFYAIASRKNKEKQPDEKE